MTYHLVWQLELLPGWTELCLQRYGETDGPVTEDLELSETELNWLHKGLHCASFYHVVAEDRLFEFQHRRRAPRVKGEPADSCVSFLPSANLTLFRLGQLNHRMSDLLFVARFLRPPFLLVPLCHLCLLVFAFLYLVLTLFMRVSCLAYIRAKPMCNHLIVTSLAERGRSNTRIQERIGVENGVEDRLK